MTGRHYSELADVDWLRAEYVDKRRSAAEIARELGCNERSVRHALKRHGIQPRVAAKPTAFPGDRFGRLTVIRPTGRVTRQGRWYLLRCDCGAYVYRTASALQRSRRRGMTGMCKRCRNVTAKTTHGRRLTPTYSSWASMIQRCTNPHNRDWRAYGGRGITVCDRWRSSFERFLSDMGEKPDWADGGIDRINGNGNYEPGNCRWATREEQRANQRPH